MYKQFVIVQRLIDFCCYELIIANSYLQHTNIHKNVWTQTTRKLESITDYPPDYIIEATKTTSNHYLLAASNISNITQIKTQDEQLTAMKSVIYNLNSLNVNLTHFIYQIRLAKLIQVKDCTSNTMYKTMKRCIHEAIFEGIGRRCTKDKKKQACILVEGRF